MTVNYKTFKKWYVTTEFGVSVVINVYVYDVRLESRNYTFAAFVYLVCGAIGLCVQNFVANKPRLTNL